MITKFYGKNISLQSLRKYSGITREGVSLLGISEAAEKLGFHTISMKVDYESFLDEAPLPCIVHWNQNHFVVVYDIRQNKNYSIVSLISKYFAKSSVTEIFNLLRRKTTSKNGFFIPDNELNVENKAEQTAKKVNDKKIYIADPSKGLGSVSEKDFLNSWSSTSIEDKVAGVALFLEPTPNFYNIENEKSNSLNLGKLLGYFRPYYKLILQLVIGLIIGSCFQFLLPFLAKSIVDIGINGKNINFLYIILIAQLSLIAGKTTIELLRSWTLLHISTRVNVAIITDFLGKLMRLPMSFFDTKNFGDLLQRINDHDRIESFLTGQTLQTLFSTGNLVVLATVLANYNKNIFTIFLVGSTLYGMWILIFLKKQRKLDFKLFNTQASNQSSLIQILDGIQEIKLNNSEQIRRWEWEINQAKLLQLRIKVLSLSQVQQTGAILLNEGKNIIITFLAAKYVISDQITLGTLVAIQYIVGQLNNPIEQLITFVKTGQNAKISLERLNEIHDINDESNIIENTRTSLFKNKKDISIKNVTFKYPGAGESNILYDINLVIPDGKVTAIVGMSGSGKTTLLKLLLRFYEPNNGGIYKGNVNLNQINHRSWRSLCGAVMQDGYIFSDTIARNIAVSEDEYNEEKLWYAIETANLCDLIDQLPLGINTKIGNDGNGLSQGQKQRILIARVVYKNPQYIFFDEATNALDANNEKIISDNLKYFFQERTVVIVAHRLSTVRNADQIVVLENGSVKEIGTHEALTSTGGAYFQLVKNQLELGK
jgi:ATP-binding cassette subfamily B protein